MGLKIIGALGTAQYNVLQVKYKDELIVKYNKKGEDIMGSPYSLITILHYINKYNNKLVKDGVEFIILNTEQSKNYHFNNEVDNVKIKYENNNRIGNDYNLNNGYLVSNYLNLRAELDYYIDNKIFDFPIKYNNIDVKNNYNDDDKWKFFNNIYNELYKSDDNIIIDITNGNRTFPTMMMFDINFYESIVGDDLVKGVFYVNTNTSELISLSNMYYITKWTNAINTYLKSGSYKNYRDLVKTLVDNYSDKEIALGIKKVSKCLEAVIDAFKLMKIGFYMKFPKKKVKYEHFVTYKIVMLLREIKDFKETTRNRKSDELLILLKAIEGIKDQFDWLDIEDKYHYSKNEWCCYLNHNFYKHMYYLLNYFKNHEMYQQAITLIKEVLYPIKQGNPISIASRNKTIDNKERIIISYYQQFYNKINQYLKTKENNVDFVSFIKQLDMYHEMRNRINHAFQINIGRLQSDENIRQYEFVVDYYDKLLSIIKKEENKFKNNDIEEFLDNHDHFIKDITDIFNSYHCEIVESLGI